MLILILVDVQYLEDPVFSSKSLLLKFPPADKKFPLRKITITKTCNNKDLQ